MYNEYDSQTFRNKITWDRIVWVNLYSNIKIKCFEIDLNTKTWS